MLSAVRRRLYGILELNSEVFSLRMKKPIERHADALRAARADAAGLANYP